MKSNDADPQRGAPPAGTPLRLADGTPMKGRNDVPAPPVDTALTRRNALKMFSATALLTATGCTRKPKRHVVATVDRPEYRRPGMPLHYASTFTDGDVPYGVLIKTIDGRPIKIEGLPEHPLSQGKSTATMQASTLALYDPERLKGPENQEGSVSWEAADKAIVAKLRAASSAVLVTRGALGPSERKIATAFLGAVRGAKHFVYEPADDRARRGAWADIYGGDGLLVPDFETADCILSLDSDFLGTDGDQLSNNRQFAARRGARTTDSAAALAKKLSRLYVAESGMTVTGTAADHRLAVRPGAMRDLVLALRKAVGGDAFDLGEVAKKQGLRADVLKALAADLKAAGNKALVVAGPHLPASVHGAVALLNGDLGGAGTTFRWNPQPATLPASDPQEIARALSAGPDVALFLGVNPAHDWAGGGFGDLLGKTKFTVGHGLAKNETLAMCTYALPSTHWLENWNDAQSLPGVTSYQQPMIAPLFDGRQEAESLLLWTKQLAPKSVPAAVADFHDYVQANASGSTAWTEVLRRGFVGDAAQAGLTRPSLNESAAAKAAADKTAVGNADTVDVVFSVDNTTGDGRFVGNAWLQELADPVTKLVWDNAVALAPATAKRLGVETGHWVKLTVGSASLELPVLITAGVAPGAASVPMGYGRTMGAGVGNEVGVNVAPLRNGSRVAMGASISKSGRSWYELVVVQGSFDQHDRPLSLSATLDEYKSADHKEFAKAPSSHVRRGPDGLPAQIDPGVDYSKGYKWAMAIDLNACTGCGACTIACQAENNVQVVGKEECGMNRDMPWIRLDRYEWFAEDDVDHQDPIIDHQPMLCQHCDNAPCETVCPVNATAHSPEGLNEQVYNRCVGTRYCLNNCPYKVRKFNFYNYTRRNMKAPEQELGTNPHVTVRMRGVMEKCTFCIQRINDAKFKASNAAAATHEARIPDGTIQTACLQACPSGAIVFGDVNDETSAVAKAREHQLAYLVLEELNVRPNVTYLAKVRNPNPAIKTRALGHGGGH